VAVVVTFAPATDPVFRIIESELSNQFINLFNVVPWSIFLMVANGVVKKNRVAAFIGAFVATAATLSIAVPTVLSQTRQEIRIDGSSTVYPITEAVAEEFMNGDTGTNVSVSVSGTGGGFRRFCAGETDISNASRPIKETEIAACRDAGVRYIELPVAYDALSIVVSQENDWLESLTVEELKLLWEPSAQGRVTRWNQVRSSFPDTEIVLYGPGTDSGTFDYFTEAIMGESGSSRADFTASEDDNVLVQGVVNDPNALAYFGFAYYIENQDRLQAVAIDGGDGPVLPSSENVEQNVYTPLSRPLFIYVNADRVESVSKLQEFVEYYLSRPDLAEEVGYVRLPGTAYDAARRNLREGRTGTVFGSGINTIGVSIQDLLDLEGVE